MDNLLLYATMFGNKKPDAPRPLNDSGRSLISETFSLEGTLRTSGAIDIAGLIKGPVYTNDLIIKETGSIIGPVETDKICLLYTSPSPRD